MPALLPRLLPRLLTAVLLFPGFAGSVRAGDPPPSVCSTEMDEVDQALCKSAALGKLDLDLSQLGVAVLTALPDSDKTPFMSAQNHWLGLRGEACLIPLRAHDEDGLARCLTALYAQRKKELRLQQRLLAADYGPRLSGTTVEAALDTPAEVYSPLTVHDRRGALPAERALHTCRDYFTFTAAGWQVDTDRRSRTGNSAVAAGCAYHLFLTVARRPKQPFPAPFDPADPLNFTYGFGQLADLAAGGEGIGESLRTLLAAGTMTLVQGEPATDALCDEGRDSEPLYRFSSGYSFNCGYFRIKEASRGDFDGKGTESALLLLYAHGEETGDRFFLVQGRYDPLRQALRPELRSWIWEE